MEQKQVVITGFKILSSVGWNTEDNTDVLYNRSVLNIDQITRYNIQDTSLRYGAQITEKIDNTWDRKLKKYASLKDVGALSTIKQVWDESGACGVYDIKRSSLYTGMGSNQVGDLSGYFQNVLHCLDDNFKFNSSKFGSTLLDIVNPMIVMEAILNNTLCYGSKYLEFRGRNSNFMDWEAASFWAIHDGFYSIREGRSDVAVVGGTSATLDPFNVMEDYHSGYYRNDDSVESLRKNVVPYGTRPTGSIPVEGSCYLILEEKSQAEKRGANILAKLCGIKPLWGKEQALSYVIKSVMEESSCKDEDLCFITGSGCGTPLDNLELQGVGDVIKEPTLMFSPRSSFYNMIEPSAALAVASSIISFNNGKLPPTLNYDDKVTDTKLRISSKSQDIDSSKSKALIPCISRTGVSGAMILERI